VRGANVVVECIVRGANVVVECIISASDSRMRMCVAPLSG
jgi:hypothetical protein